MKLGGNCDESNWQLPENISATAAKVNIETPSYTATQGEVTDANTAKAEALVDALELKGTTYNLYSNSDFTSEVYTGGS